MRFTADFNAYDTFQRSCRTETHESVARFLSYLLVSAILGCGSTTITDTPSNAPTLNGSYSFIALSHNAGTNIFTFGGPIQTDANGHGTANFGVTSVAPTNTCFPAGSAGSFTGTRAVRGSLR